MVYVPELGVAIGSPSDNDIYKEACMILTSKASIGVFHREK